MATNWQQWSAVGMGPALTNRSDSDAKARAKVEKAKAKVKAKAAKAKAKAAKAAKATAAAAEAAVAKAAAEAEAPVTVVAKAKAAAAAVAEASAEAGEAEAAGEAAGEAAASAAASAEAVSLNRWTGGNEQYCEAREWWLKKTDCSENELQQHLIEHFGYIAGSGDEAERAHKIAACLCQSEPRQSASVDTISLVVSLFALVISVCAGQFINYPQIARWALLIAIIAILLFMVIWVGLKTVIDRCLDRDTEFRGRLSVL